MEKFGYPKNLIIDTDMGWDDVIAILLLMKNPNIRICGITVTGCGETHLESGVAIAQGLLALGNISAPVCRGATSPTMYNHQFPPSFRERMDKVCGFLKDLPAPQQPVARGWHGISCATPWNAKSTKYQSCRWAV